MFEKRVVYAIVLAAGAGSRMKMAERKQFIEILGKPMYRYSLEAFQGAPEVDHIILVTDGEDLEALKALRLEEAFPKLFAIREGGVERYHSVYAGLHAIEEELVHQSFLENGKENPIVLIHDCARPGLTSDVIHRSIEAADQYEAVVVGVPAKDTIKILDDENFVESTPDRAHCWLMQTPQSFSYDLIWKAYAKLMAKDRSGTLAVKVTDDAMVVETFMKKKVRIIEGDERNIKVTTKGDLRLAELYLNEKK